MKFGSYFIILGMLLPTASGADEAQTNFDSATTGAPAQTAPTLTQTAAGVQSTESLAVSDVNYSLVPRKPELNFFPCSMCHQFLEPNPEQRVLNSPQCPGTRRRPILVPDLPRPRRPGSAAQY